MVFKANSGFWNSPAMQAALLFRRSLIFAVIGMIMLGGSVWFGINTAVDSAVSADADHKAREWATYFIEEMPNLNHLVTTGLPDARQMELIGTAQKIGDIFRFKLYDHSGVLTLVSDKDGSKVESNELEEDSASAVAVMHTRMSKITLHDGSGEENRPSW
jgi:hypothetical protein